MSCKLCSLFLCTLSALADLCGSLWLSLALNASRAENNLENTVKWSQRAGHDWATHTLTFLASLGAQTVKNPPAVQETWVQSLGQEDPLEKGMATHSGLLPWKIPWTEEPSRPQSMGLNTTE